MLPVTPGRFIRRSEATSRSRSGDILLLLVALNVLLLVVASLEILPFQNGFQYDSAIYAIHTRQFAASGFAIRLDDYYIQRLLPSAIVGGAARLLGTPVSKEFIASGFRVLDLAAINAAFLFLAAALGRFGITGRSRLLALVLAFGNFCVLKYALYSPVLTDCTALAIAAGLLYAYAAGRSVLLAILGVAGAFTQPLLPVAALLLFLFPRAYSAIAHHAAAPGWFRWIPVAAGAAYMVLCLLVRLFADEVLTAAANAGLAPVSRGLYVLSAAGASAYVYWVTRLAVTGGVLQKLRCALRPRRLIPALALIIAVVYVRGSHSYGHGRLDAGAFAVNVFIGSLTAPLQFLVAHATFFGPLVLLIILFQREFAAELLCLDAGLQALCIGLLLLAVGSESRQYNIALPFVTVPLGLVLSQRPLTRLQAGLTLALALLLSKVWLPLHNTWTLLPQPDPRLNQWLYLNMGPWMRFEAYAVQLGILAAATLLLRRAFCGSRVVDRLPGTA